MAVALVLLQRLQGGFGGGMGILGLQVLDRLAQERLGGEGLQLADRGVQSGESLGLGGGVFGEGGVGEAGACADRGLFGQERHGRGQGFGPERGGHGDQSDGRGMSPGSPYYA